jgi:hypothetical protein
VMEVLTAFIREHSREPWPPPDAQGGSGRVRISGWLGPRRRSRPDSPEQKPSTRPDIQAAVTVVGRREVKRDILVIDLAGADLGPAHLAARFTGADLDGVRWPEGAQVPDGWMVDSGSGRLVQVA